MAHFIARSTLVIDPEGQSRCPIPCPLPDAASSDHQLHLIDPFDKQVIRGARKCTPSHSTEDMRSIMSSSDETCIGIRIPTGEQVERFRSVDAPVRAER